MSLERPAKLMEKSPGNKILSIESKSISKFSSLMFSLFIVCLFVVADVDFVVDL